MSASVVSAVGRGWFSSLLVLMLWPLPAGAAQGASLPFPKDPIAFQKAGLTFSTSALAFGTDLQSHESASLIEVTLASDVLFDFDKADLRAGAASTLHTLADLIRSKARGSVSINGYTDGLGGDGYNQRLSERRAASVKGWLVARERLSSVGFTTAGFGPRNPVAPNRHPDGSDDSLGRQRNRRVTILIRK